MGGTAAIDIILRLRPLRLVAIDRRLGQEAALLAAPAGLRGANAIYAALARHLSVPLVTWDDELQEPTGKLLVVQRPARPES